MIGGEGAGATTAMCRLVADHPDQAGVQLLAREQSSGISHMSVGITLGPPATVRPVQCIAGFLLPKSVVHSQTSRWTATRRVPPPPIDAMLHRSSAPAFPPSPKDADPALTLPLIRLAWARSGDKGNLFNVAVIARRPDYLPYIAAALTPEKISAHYGRLLADGQPLSVDIFSAPGLSALNFVVKDSMDGGVLASAKIDPVAKGMAQLLLDFPIPVSAAVQRQCGADSVKGEH